MVPKEAVPKKYMERLQRLKPSLSSFIVWLGLNCELRGKIQGGDIYIYTGLGPEMEYQASLSGDVENTAFSVSIYDNLFKGYSQKGTTTIMIAVLSGYAPWKPFEKDYFTGEKTAYQQLKKEWTDILLRRAEERLIPGLKSMIEICVSATPLTNLRFTGNSNGAIYGFEQSMNNAFMNRIKNRTPIKGLYLTGAWAFPGGGYTAVLWSGEKTYHELMADLESEKW
jgi:prolycopene isomerase